MSLPDSGERERYEAGAVRDKQDGKGRYDLLSPWAIHRLALHYEAGAKKYEERNWEKGIPASRCISSALRHIFQWLAGSREEDHLAAAVWNLCAVMHYEELRPEILDIPYQGRKEGPGMGE